MGSTFLNITRRGRQQHFGSLLATFLKLELRLFSRPTSTASSSTEDSKLSLSPHTQLNIARFYSCNKSERCSCNDNIDIMIGIPNFDLPRISIVKNSCSERGLLNLQRLLLNDINRRGLKTSALSQGKGAEKSESSENIAKGDKVMRVKLKAQRVDAVLKSALGMSRNKVEKAIYDDRVRINGVRPEKKSQIVFEGDEVDVVRGYNELNPEKFIDVSRVEIVELGDEEGDASSGDESDPDEDNTRIPAVLRRSKLLTIKNYAKPWKGS